jgi:DNA-binding NarL/FixJ family response regulator
MKAGTLDAIANNSCSTRPSQFSLILAGESASHWRGIEKWAAREGLASVVRCTGSIEELRSICERLRPSVLVAELARVQALFSQEDAPMGSHLLGVRVLAEARSVDEDVLEWLLERGCWGTLNPGAPPRILWKAVRSVAAGQYWVSRASLTRIARRHLIGQSLGLTAREIQVLRLVARGCRNQEIAEQLFISVETVRWHLRSLYGKLGVHDRLSAAVFASGVGEALLGKPFPCMALAATGSD